MCNLQFDRGKKMVDLITYVFFMVPCTHLTRLQIKCALDELI